MNQITKILVLFLFVVCISKTQAGNGTGTKPGPGGSSDTTVSIKSNIVIFKMIPNQQNTPTAVTGTLKKAGKVARTSNSPTSLKMPIIIPPKRNL